MSIKKILNPMGSHDGTISALIKNLKIDTDLPKTLLSQSKDIAARVDSIERRLRPDVIEQMVEKVRKTEFTPRLAKAVLPGLDDLIKSYSDDLAKEHVRHDTLKSKVADAATWVTDVQIPLADFLLQADPEANEELVKKRKEIETFSRQLGEVRANVLKSEEKLRSVQERLQKLRLALLRFEILLAQSRKWRQEVLWVQKSEARCVRYACVLPDADIWS